jgi:uncharacterized protein with HEPN domain
MPKDDRVYMGHILDTARKAHEKVRGKDRAAFDADENLRLAMAHLLQIIGEAAGRLSPEFRERHPEVPWKAIVGMRHKVVHDYMNVDYNVVWRTATEELPVLLSLLERLSVSDQES